MTINMIVWAGIFLLGHALFALCPWWLIAAVVVVCGAGLQIIETDSAELLPPA